MAPLRKEKARKVKILIMGEGGSISWKESVRERERLKVRESVCS